MSVKSHQHDVLVIGSGAAGMTLALKLSTDYQVALLCKDVSSEGSTYYAQGGVAAVLDEYDSIEYADRRRSICKNASFSLSLAFTRSL